MEEEKLHQLALALVPQIGDVQARTLLHHFGSAVAVFRAKQHDLERLEGMGEMRARCIKSFRDFELARRELKFVLKYGISMLCPLDEDYPRRLSHCHDAPALLFYKGTADLNAPRMVAIVGTRNNTEYGRQFTERLVEDLAAEGVVVISGLAMGIDAIAHRAAIQHGIPTIGVVAHGLDKIYPYQHMSLARQMAGSGGLLSEFFSGTKPDRHNFPLRNRIVAGLCDALVVVETGTKGGSMITAKLANTYNRDVFALPGRTTDLKSAGCNYLIQHNRAILATGAADLLEALGWTSTRKDAPPQRALFTDLTEAETGLVQLLSTKENLHVDELSILYPGRASILASTLLSLELKGIVESLPGKRYRVI